MGLRYLATHQDVGTTRIQGREGFVAERDGLMVGTVTVGFDPEPGETGWYDREGVAAFRQFAVEPSLHGEGIGAMLLEHVETRARARYRTGCDTAESATPLIEYYIARGYRLVERADYRPVTNYESVVLSKTPFRAHRSTSWLRRAPKSRMEVTSSKTPRCTTKTARW